LVLPRTEGSPQHMWLKTRAWLLPLRPNGAARTSGELSS
jgi:hypothetical protein